MKEFIYSLFSPLGIFFLFFGTSLFLLHKNKRLTFLIIPILWLWIFSTELMCKLLQGNLEINFPQISIENIEVKEYGILLAGGLGEPSPPLVYFNLGNSADRIIHASRLYHAKKIHKLLICSGPKDQSSEFTTQGIESKKLLINLGVPESDLILMAKADTTFNEAIEVYKYSKNLNVHFDGHLITSAWHMRRALATFKSQGLNVNPVAIDQGSFTNINLLNGLLFDSGALQTSSTMWREYLGYIIYQIRGQIK